MFYSKAPTCGKISASEKIKLSRVTLRRWAYRITDNPFNKGTKEHVKWHNEFYDECKVLRRYI